MNHRLCDVTFDVTNKQWLLTILWLLLVVTNGDVSKMDVSNMDVTKHLSKVDLWQSQISPLNCCNAK